MIVTVPSSCSVTYACGENGSASDADHETTHAEHLHEAATFHVGLCHDDFSAAALMAERMRG